MTTVALLVGGGVNPELVPPMLEIVAAAGADVEWERHDVAPTRPEEVDTALTEAAEAVGRKGVALKTRFLTPAEMEGPHRNLNVRLRQLLGLYAGVRAARSLAGLPTRYPDLDLIIIRENSEDIYKGIEHEIVPGVVESLKVVTAAASERIARFAFETIRHLGRRHLTFVHKANIMKLSDGLFMDTVRRVAEDYPETRYREIIVDAACMQLVLDPYQFDVMLMGNLYGDILSSLCNGLTGGIASSLGIDIGDGIRVYEAVHGDAPHLVGTGRANPLPLLLPAVELLHFLDQHDPADRILAAVQRVLTEGDQLTPDLGGSATTSGLAMAVVAALE